MACLAGAATLAAGTACSSSSGGGSSSGASSSGASADGGGFFIAFCQVSTPATCYMYGTNTMEALVQDQGRCAGELRGSRVTACPSAGLVGCCANSSYGDWECFYSGTEATDCPAQTGAWSATLPTGAAP